MKAILVYEFGGPEVLKLEEAPYQHQGSVSCSLDFMRRLASNRKLFEQVDV
jgi:hypothetical protein